MVCANFGSTSSRGKFPLLNMTNTVLPNLQTSISLEHVKWYPIVVFICISFINNMVKHLLIFIVPAGFLFYGFITVFSSLLHIFPLGYFSFLTGFCDETVYTRLMRANCAHLFPSLHFVTSCWWLEIGHTGVFTS